MISGGIFSGTGITIWVLTLDGLFFGGRAAWRRRKGKDEG